MQKTISKNKTTLKKETVPKAKHLVEEYIVKQSGINFWVQQIEQ